MGALLKGGSTEAILARATTACVPLMCRGDAPNDLSDSDPTLYRTRHTCILRVRSRGWLR